MSLLLVSRQHPGRGRLDCDSAVTQVLARAEELDVGLPRNAKHQLDDLRIEALECGVGLNLLGLGSTSLPLVTRRIGGSDRRLFFEDDRVESGDLGTQPLVLGQELVDPVVGVTAWVTA